MSKQNAIEMKLKFLSVIGCSICLILGTLNTFAHAAESPSAIDAAVIKSVRSGSWSEPETWEGGAVPGPGARVLVRRDHTVVYDRDSDEVIRGIQVAGTLTFAKDRNTRLDVGLIRIESVDEYSEDGFDCNHAPIGGGPSEGAAVKKAALEVGMPDSPVPSQFKALIRLHHIEGMNPETCPAIVCCGGRMDLHGAPMERTWV
jgi:hypothetical protein